MCVVEITVRRSSCRRFHRVALRGFEKYSRNYQEGKAKIEYLIESQGGLERWTIYGKKILNENPNVCMCDRNHLWRSSCRKFHRVALHGYEEFHELPKGSAKIERFNRVFCWFRRMARMG